MKTAHEFLESKGWNESDPTTGGALQKGVALLLDEYAAQFAPKWIPVDEFDGEQGQLVVVKGVFRTELGDSTEPSTGFVQWGSKEHSECVNICYYGTWYTDITEVFVIPKTV